MVHFRYLVPKTLFEKLTKLCEERAPSVVWGRIFADRKENFAVASSFEIDEERSQNEGHTKPKSWMRMKKTKIKSTRQLKDEFGYDIIWNFHTHPSGNPELHEIDLKILNYLSVGVMIIVTQKEIVGWYYDKRSTKKPIIEKMVFEIIDDM
ncbi:MAG: hypothetical protein ACTSVI_10325 [Promethearchaeota archaeon]